MNRRITSFTESNVTPTLCHKVNLQTSFDYYILRNQSQYPSDYIIIDVYQGVRTKKIIGKTFVKETGS